MTYSFPNSHNKITATPDETCHASRSSPIEPAPTTCTQNMAAPPNSCTVVETRCHGAKRARTEVADQQPCTLSGEPAADPICNWRDWANLTVGLTDLIAERVLADDVADYLRFRAVCSSWRRRTASPHDHGSLDRRFLPRRWIMLPQTFGAIRKRRGFLNLSTGERFLADLPELRHQHVFGRTSDGLIALCDRSTYAVSLLNPLTRQLTAFPNGTTLYPPESQTIPGWSNSRLAELEALGAGPADESSAMALHFDEHHLAVARPGAERWSLWARCWSTPIFATVSFASRFYCATEKGIMAVEFAADSERPQLVVAAEAEDGCSLQCPDPNTVNLVDNDGELILVSSSAWLRMANLPSKYEVHRVDLDAGKLVPMHGLRGRAVFVGDDDCHGLALSVPVGLSSSIRADTVYRCSEREDDDGWRVDAYHLLDGSVERDFRGGKTVDYLSRYVCRSDDTVVPDAAPRKRKANAAKVMGKELVERIARAITRVQDRRRREA